MLDGRVTHGIHEDINKGGTTTANDAYNVKLVFTDRDDVAKLVENVNDVVSGSARNIGGEGQANRPSVDGNRGVGNYCHHRIIW